MLNRSTLHRALAALAFTAAALAAPQAVLAQAQCAKLQDAYEGAIKEISAAVWSNVMNGSDSVQNRTDRVFYASLAQTNLTLLQANKCAAPTLPVTENAYQKNAFDCGMAASGRQRKEPSSREPIPECARENWTRNPAK